jgi:flagellar motor protein MotB
MAKQDSEYISRRKKRDISFHESNESWAVSYSDFLMVLLSFFVIYFNIEDSTSSNELQKLVLELSKNSDYKIVEHKSDLQTESSDKVVVHLNLNSTDLKIDSRSSQKIDRKIASVDDDVVTAFQSGFVSKNNEKQSGAKSRMEVLIDLPPDVYQVGKFDVNENVKVELDKILSLIKNSKDYVNLIVIGQTDSINFAEKNKSIINNNLILSSMRAAKAVEYAIQSGFDESRVFVQGLNHQPRNTRSLTIKLVER